MYIKWDRALTQAIYQGFILSRQQYSSKHSEGITLCYWLASDHGPIKVVIENQQAVFFISQEQQQHAQQLLDKAHISVNFKTVEMSHFSGKACVACYFNNTSSLYKARTLFENTITIYEGDIRHSDRFLMERFITADITFVGQQTQLTRHSFLSQATNLSNNQNYRRFEQVKCKPIDKKKQTDITLSTVSLDIECSISGELYSICLLYTSPSPRD